MNRTQNKELHDTLRALDVQLPCPENHRAELRRALLHARPRRRFFVTRLFDVLANHNGGSIMQKTKSIAPAGVALAAIALVGVLTFTSVTRSPHALAKAITANSISSLGRVSQDQLEDISSRFSVDPVSALQEAKEAKDLKTISRSDFEQLKKTAKTIATTSEVKRLSGGGFEASGSIEGDAGAGSVGGGTVTQPPSSGTTQSSGGQGVSYGGRATPQDATTQSQGDPVAAALAQNQAKATKFVSYTNAAGNSVVIGFDASNLPLFKTVFIK